MLLSRQLGGGVSRGAQWWQQLLNDVFLVMLRVLERVGVEELVK